MGTLGVAGHRGVVQRVRAAAKGAGKKTYTILMGKPSPYKLANFPEIEVFVMIADPQVWSCCCMCSMHTRAPSHWEHMGNESAL